MIGGDDTISYPEFVLNFVFNETGISCVLARFIMMDYF